MRVSAPTATTVSPLRFQLTRAAHAQNSSYLAYLHQTRFYTCLTLSDTQGMGDTVIARVLPDRPGQVVIEGVEGDGGKLSLEAAKNCSGETF